MEKYNIADLVSAIGVPAMLEQAAEETTELGFACLKYARMLRGDNKVHGRTKEELIDNLTEEIADIQICIWQMMSSGIVKESEVESIIKMKAERMRNRLEADHD